MKRRIRHNMNNEKLVAEVFLRRPLWDVNNKHYNKHVVTYGLWNDVAITLNQDCTSIKKRWKNLRDTYRQEVKKIRDNVITSSKWALFEKLNFVQEVGGKRNPANIFVTSETEMSSEEDEIKKIKKRKFNKGMKLKPKQKLKLKHTSKSDDILKVFEAIEKEKLNILKENKQLKNDADYNFLFSFLPLIKSMSEVSKLKFRTEMCRTLMEVKQEDDNMRATLEDKEIGIRDRPLLQKTTPPPPSSIQLRPRGIRKNQSFTTDVEHSSDLQYDQFIIKTEGDTDAETIEISYENVCENTVAMSE